MSLQIVTNFCYPAPLYRSQARRGKYKFLSYQVFTIPPHFTSEFGLGNLITCSILGKENVKTHQVRSRGFKLQMLPHKGQTQGTSTWVGCGHTRSTIVHFKTSNKNCKSTLKIHLKIFNLPPKNQTTPSNENLECGIAQMQDNVTFLCFSFFLFIYKKRLQYKIQSVVC